ncbi:transposase, MuDR, MULE transposase domain protein [Tanacetum coccineum]
MAKLRKIANTQEGGEESVIMLDYVNVDGGIVMGCFGDVKKLLKNGKLEKVVAVIKSCTPNALGDLTVTLKDLSGTIFDTIHYKVLTKERFAKTITIGATLILHNVSVLSPKQ